MITFLKITFLFNVIWSSKATVMKNANVLMISADDMGWNDVSFHGSDQIPTPNIDTLANSGVILQRYYSHCACTPSRAAMLTGKFAYKLGLQGYPLTQGERRGLPLEEKLLPQYFKDLGYTTHLVGKWHLGHYKKAYWPQKRGFDSFYGNKGGMLDYYEYTADETKKWGINETVSGLDLFRGFEPDWNAEGYLTDLYRDEAKKIIAKHDTSKPFFMKLAFTAPHSTNKGAPLQAPEKDVRAMRHIASPERRIYAAMVKKLDEAIGDVIEALSVKGILKNTIIVFISDNGGPTQGLINNWSSNRPLRSQKMTAFEGSLRVVGALWAPTLTKNKHHMWDGYIHAVDWVPTLLGAVGANAPKGIDGKNLWDDISNNNPSKRNEIFEINSDIGAISLIQGKYKLVVGNKKLTALGYYGSDLEDLTKNPPSYSNSILESKTYRIFKKNKYVELNAFVPRQSTKLICDKQPDNCDPTTSKWCLYNIIEDPCETTDISTLYPKVAEELKSLLDQEISKEVAKPPQTRDPAALPSQHNYVWTSWLDEDDQVTSSNSQNENKTKDNKENTATKEEHESNAFTKITNFLHKLPIISKIL